MEGAVVKNVSEIDWWNATLRDDYKYSCCEGPMDNALVSLTFDFTKLLPDEWELLGDDEFKEFFERNYTEKSTRIAQPKNPNF